MTGYFGNRSVVVATGLLLCQAAVFYWLARNEAEPATKPFAELPAALGGWVAVSDEPMDELTMDNLKPDDYLLRTYQGNGALGQVGLMVVYFKSQSTEKAPHSPRNCLPGHGWVPNRFGVIQLPARVGSTAVEVNRYVIAKGDAKAVVLYWYQSATRVVANEYISKLYLILDSARFRRSDTALVRVTVPVGAGGEVEAERLAVDFAQGAEAAVRRHIPPVQPDGRQAVSHGD